MIGPFSGLIRRLTPNPDFDESIGLLVNPAGAWQHASLEQKQRLRQVLFLQGIEYRDGVYRNQETSFLFMGLE